MREDVSIYPRLVALAACLCTELTKAEIPASCFCGVLAGDGSLVPDPGNCPDADDHDGACGSAWARLVQSFPSSQFPGPDVEPTSYDSPWAFEIEVGVLRCTKVMEDDGTSVGVDEQLAMARLQLADMAAMRRAIRCCFESDDDDGPPQYVVAPYTPWAWQGGVGGGLLSVTVQERF